jgi:hypothetical protein
MNEAQVGIVYHSKSKRENLNVYIYCCIKNISYQKKCPQKGRINQEDHEIIATLKKCTICFNLNMCMISPDY